jgi:hypothetical protein
MADPNIDIQWQRLGRLQEDRPVFSIFENWPVWFFYIPVALAWLVLAARYRGLTLPALVDPAIKLSGLCGESKSSILKLFGPTGRELVAPYVSSKKGENVTADVAVAVDKMRIAHIDFPIVVKPDISCRGTGVTIARDSKELSSYLARFPRNADFIIQKLVTDKGEAGIFYVRMPEEDCGKIISLTLKYFPSVIGDGLSTLRQLILNDRRAQRIASKYFARHRERLDTVVPESELVELVNVGNHVRGAIFRDGRQFITASMEKKFDEIAKEIPNFRFGRFDIRFNKLSDLCHSMNFFIIELNGASSEATHIWDRDTKLFDAYKALFEQLRIAFVIGAYHRHQGYRPPSVFEVVRTWFWERRLMSSYDG